MVVGEVLDVAAPDDYLAYHTAVPALLSHPSVGNLGNSRLAGLNGAAIEYIESRLDTLVTVVLSLIAW